ncbi:S-adenosyl-L-methionine-dependent methyltransferase [Tricladium varicosporioides]|nr:S-adenosyl-L-methionine-dependent methyltransferase [Hymenoscyphus varicosporioides]
MTTQITPDRVVEHYSALVEQDLSRNTEHIKQVAESFGYSAEDLAAVPEGANLGVSCGNPLAIAGLRSGETVVDLGCGAGFDVFQAARKVGPSGKSIGIDLSDAMLAKARGNAEKAGIMNTEFILAPITALPLSSNTVDCVISNCVINLLPPSQKPVCFAEVFRILKPGGRLSVSDILAKKEFGEEMRQDLALYVGCVSGASLVEEYESWLKSVGFSGK